MYRFLAIRERMVRIPLPDMGDQWELPFPAMEMGSGGWDKVFGLVTKWDVTPQAAEGHPVRPRGAGGSGGATRSSVDHLPGPRLSLVPGAATGPGEDTGTGCRTLSRIALTEPVPTGERRLRRVARAKACPAHPPHSTGSPKPGPNASSRSVCPHPTTHSCPVTPCNTTFLPRFPCLPPLTWVRWWIWGGGLEILQVL